MIPGRTCKYRTYINNNVSTTVLTSGVYKSEAYNVTVNVDYVYKQTYLGVYKYHIDSNSYELVREVNQFFIGNIRTMIDINTEIYVQIHPYNLLSHAEFTVYTHLDSSSSSTENSYEISENAIKLIQN